MNRNENKRADGQHIKKTHKTFSNFIFELVKSGNTHKIRNEWRKRRLNYKFKEKTQNAPTVVERCSVMSVTKDARCLFSPDSSYRVCVCVCAVGPLIICHVIIKQQSSKRDSHHHQTKNIKIFVSSSSLCRYTITDAIKYVTQTKLQSALCFSIS